MTSKLLLERREALGERARDFAAEGLVAHQRQLLAEQRSSSVFASISRTVGRMRAGVLRPLTAAC
jgi:hypothetical protein